jgi:putative hydrolase of the HAD superfamily
VPRSLLGGNASWPITFPAVPTPRAVLLDVGGIFHLPDPEIVTAACARGGFSVDLAGDPTVVDRAHYVGTTAFTIDYAGELPWDSFWNGYLAAYVETLGVSGEEAGAVREHLDAEFATAAIWRRIIPGSVDALRALEATGVRLGVVSNADGLVGQRLREQEVLQVGPGLGVTVECLIDSGEVGVSKPDPRIFQLALDAMGLEPVDAWYVGDMPGIDVVGARAAGLEVFVMDPYGVHDGADFERVTSLHEVAVRVTK